MGTAEPLSSISPCAPVAFRSLEELLSRRQRCAAHSRYGQRESGEDGVGMGGRTEPGNGMGTHGRRGAATSLWVRLSRSGAERRTQLQSGKVRPEGAELGGVGGVGGVTELCVCGWGSHRSPSLPKYRPHPQRRPHPGHGEHNCSSQRCAAALRPVQKSRTAMERERSGRSSSAPTCPPPPISSSPPSPTSEEATMRDLRPPT